MPMQDEIASVAVAADDDGARASSGDLLDDLSLEGSGSRMLVRAEHDACLRDRSGTFLCRDPQRAPLLETYRAGDVGSAAIPSCAPTPGSTA